LRESEGIDEGKLEDGEEDDKEDDDHNEEEEEEKEDGLPEAEALHFTTPEK